MQGHPASDNCGEGKEMLGLHVYAIYNSLGTLLLLRGNPAQLGVVDAPDGVLGTYGGAR